jgi:hypothetical protein
VRNNAALLISFHCIGGGRSLAEFTLNFSARIADAFDGPLHPFLALADLFGFVSDFIVLTACYASAILRAASACSCHNCFLPLRNALGSRGVT